MTPEERARFRNERLSRAPLRLENGIAHARNARNPNPNPVSFSGSSCLRLGLSAAFTTKKTQNREVFGCVGIFLD